MAEVLTETATTSGFADYAYLVSGRTRLILEAKKDGISLGCESREAGRAYKLSGGAFTTQAAKDGISQTIRYCSEKSAELACLTNGREWIIFRGSRLGDGVDVRAGMAFVFPTLGSIEQNFGLFYSLLFYESASLFNYRPYFQEAEGQPIRTSVFSRPLRLPGSARFQGNDQLAVDIDKVLGTFFRRLADEGDDELIDACFVETNESYHAERQIARIAENIVTRLKQVETGSGEQLTQPYRARTRNPKARIRSDSWYQGIRQVEFISRFFGSVLPEQIRRHCAVLRVDLGKSTGDVHSLIDWMNRALIEQAERDLFDGAPGYNEIQGMFFDEYKRLLKGPLKNLYESDKDAFHLRFGETIEETRRARPHEYIQGILRHVINSRLMLPVVVFDNADHFGIEFQQRVYQYARSIYEPTLCLVILPITDRTSWQLTKHGALQSFEHEAFFLPAPPTKDVIQKRIQFLERRVIAERTKPDERYFLGKGIALSIDDLDAFARTLQRVFLQTSNVADWIGSLANYDVRRTLNLVRLFVSSPHLRVVDLLNAYLAGSGVIIQQNRAAKALIRSRYDIYPVNQHDFVQNVFALNEDLATTPLLGVRILQLLSDVPVKERQGALIEVHEIAAYCAGMGVEARAVLLWLDAMLKSGLILDYDPTVQDVAQAYQIEISPSGKQHLVWGLHHFEYANSMADVTPILTESVHTQLRQDIQGSYSWQRKTITFLEYLLIEDKTYCIPA